MRGNGPDCLRQRFWRSLSNIVQNLQSLDYYSCTGETLSDRWQHHDDNVLDISEQLRDQGYSVENEVNISSPDGTSITRTDIIFVRPDGTVGIIEVKTGNASTTTNQSSIFPSIEDGSAVVTQQMADRLNSSLPDDTQLVPGKTIAESGFPDGISIYVVRAPGL